MTKLDVVKELGRNVRHYRKNASLGQKELAARAGVSVVAIRRLEQGVSAPSLEKIDRIAAALGEQLWVFFNWGDKSRELPEDKRREIDKVYYMLRQHSLGEIRLARGILLEIFEIQRLGRK